MASESETSTPFVTAMSLAQFFEECRTISLASESGIEARQRQNNTRTLNMGETIEVDRTPCGDIRISSFFDNHYVEEVRIEGRNLDELILKLQQLKFNPDGTKS